jgi:hypothetical protein
LNKCLPFGGSDLSHFRRIAQAEDAELSARKLAKAVRGTLGKYFLLGAFSTFGPGAAKDLQRDFRMLGELLRHRSLQSHDVDR